MRLVDTSAWIEWLIASPTGKALASAISAREDVLVARVVGGLADGARPLLGRGRRDAEAPVVPGERRDPPASGHRQRNAEGGTIRAAGERPAGAEYHHAGDQTPRPRHSPS